MGLAEVQGNKWRVPGLLIGNGSLIGLDYSGTAMRLFDGVEVTPVALSALVNANNAPVLETLVADGVAALGPITLTGAGVGDRLVSVVGQVKATQAFVAVAEAQFESIVTVVDQIQQAAGNLTLNTYAFVLAKA